MILVGASKAWLTLRILLDKLSVAFRKTFTSSAARLKPWSNVGGLIDKYFELRLLC